MSAPSPLPKYPELGYHIEEISQAEATRKIYNGLITHNPWREICRGHLSTVYWNITTGETLTFSNTASKVEYMRKV